MSRFENCDILIYYIEDRFVFLRPYREHGPWNHRPPHLKTTV